MKVFIYTYLCVPMLMYGCCDLRGITGNPCLIDKNGEEQGSSQYKADEAKWWAQYQSGQITHTQYLNNIGY